MPGVNITTLSADENPARSRPELSPGRLAGFRLRLLAANMLVVVVITGLALYFTQQRLASGVQMQLEGDFANDLVARHNAQQVRYAALVERSRALVRKPRIHAALEDDALELLYPNAEDELRDLMAADDPAAPARGGLHAVFYRFLDRNGAVIAPPNSKAVGELRPEEDAFLSLRGAPTDIQLGYLIRPGAELAEVIALPIVSSETGEVIAALALGFKPFAFGSATRWPMLSGIAVNGATDNPLILPAAQVALGSRSPLEDNGPWRIAQNGRPQLAFSKLLNPGSAYPAAYEICVYPLDELVGRQRQLRWQVLGAGALLLVTGLFGSHFLSVRLSAPVERMAVDSAENLALRRRAELALEMTSAELQRSARFSADASHQLKTPVTVLRAGLEELLARENFTPEQCGEIAALIHQTYRLSSLIQDLLLLSRLDAGRLKLELVAVNLTELIEACQDDLGAVPDEMNLRIETDFPRGLHIAGEKRYTSIILQNLLENARKYNLAGGSIQIAARRDDGEVALTITNTGQPIAPAAQAHIFERFHRGAMGENVPGYGLGLNLARELARLHGGDLRLLFSDAGGTRFEVRFRAAEVPT